jgi:F-type H+-transporting ATPase subunit b
MENIMSINPGLIIWTLINFGIFLFIFIKIFGKRIVNGLKDRENLIQSRLDSAATASNEAKKLLGEAEEKFAAAHSEIAAMMARARQQQDELIKKAMDEAERIKRNKIDDAAKEIERTKESALKELRTEVATLAVQAAEKILGQNLNKEKHIEIVNSYIDKLPKN